MALRAIEPFQNLSHPYSGTFHAYGPILSGWNLPYLGYSGDTNNYVRVIDISKVDDWLLLSSTGSVFGGRQVGMGRKFVDFDVNIKADSVIYGGVRMKFARSIPNVLVYTSGSGAQAIVSSSQVPGGVVAGVEYYIEWCIDMPNGMFRARVDGVEVTPVAIGASVKTYLLQGVQYLMYGSWNTGVTSAVDIYLRDGYVLEKTPDGLMSSWLGPQRVRRLPVAEFVAPWAASNGAEPKDVLNTPVTTAANRLTPVVISDSDVTEAIVKFDTSVIQGKINGVSINTSATKPGGKVGNVELVLSSAGVDGAKTTIVPTTEMLMFSRIGLSSKAPNGSAWTAENLAAATLKLKPVN